MKLIDTHTHLYLPEYDSDRSEVIFCAINAGVSTLLMPNVDVSTIEPMLSTCAQHPDVCFPMIGLHPTSVDENYKEQLDIILKTAAEHHFIAIGEIGLDLYWDKSYLKQQIEVLTSQLDFALCHDMPVAIHTREAMTELFTILESYKGKNTKGVLHAFSGNAEEAFKAIDMGFMLGIGGQVTYKKTSQVEVVKAVGINNILLETDSPYLTPVPHRGKRNESSYICNVNQKVAEILDMDPEETAYVTSQNAKRVFRLL